MTLFCKKLKKTWLKVLKAEIKRKTKKVKKLEKRMMEIEFQLRKHGCE